MSKRKSKARKVKIDKDSTLLGELATLDDVTAYIPTARDHTDGSFPHWCELMLEIKREHDDGSEPVGPQGSPGEWPINYRIPLRRHDGELIIEVLDEVLHPSRGNGTADKMWLMLDDAIERIMKRVNKGKDPRDDDRGEAVGLTKALAALVMPFEAAGAAEDQIRDIAMERYAIRNGL